jgi:hypothetical protein
MIYKTPNRKLKIKKDGPTNKRDWMQLLRKGEQLVFH